MSIPLLSIYLQSLLAIQERTHVGGEGSRILQNVVRLTTTPPEGSALKRIRDTRKELARNYRELSILDFGAGGVGLGGKRTTTVSELYRVSAVPHRWGVFLFRLVREIKPARVLELGTNLGVSACYIQTALDMNGSGTLTTLEGDPELARMARQNIAAVSTGTVEITVGRFQEMLGPVLQKFSPVDMVFLDGHHEYEATLRYFNLLSPHLAQSHCLVFDDIYPWTRPVRKAWKEIVARHPGKLAFDSGKLGVLLSLAGSA